jgi:hypothetical protein
MNLFQYGKFTSAAGRELDFKIECDALTPEDWDCLARLIVDRVGPFGQVMGVPTGGYPLQDALWKYQKGGDFPILVVDDVWTTGQSMLNFVKENNINQFDWNGYVVFARVPIINAHVKALFTME